MEREDNKVKWLLFLAVLIALMMIFKEQLAELLNDIYQKANAL